jgi:hypothetical protein
MVEVREWTDFQSILLPLRTSFRSRRGVNTDNSAFDSISGSDSRLFDRLRNLW